MNYCLKSNSKTALWVSAGVGEYNIRLQNRLPKMQSPRKCLISEGLRLLVADRTGLEPATSAVTGQHSNQLNYRSIISIPVFVFKMIERIIFSEL